MNNSNNDLEAFRNVSEVRVGQIVAAEFPNERNMRNIEYHRAKIIAINSKPNNLTFTVSLPNIIQSHQRKHIPIFMILGAVHRFR